MKRKIYEQLLKWKNESGGHTALLIDGARRVGKSYIAEEFARNEYEAYLLIDFSKVSSKVKVLFREHLEDLDTFFMLLFSFYHVNLPRGKSLIIFDEVQRFPRAREAIKHLVADGRYHYSSPVMRRSSPWRKLHLGRACGATRRRSSGLKAP